MLLKIQARRAEELNQKALAGIEKIPDSDDELTLKTVSELGLFYLSKVPKPQEASKLLSHAVSGRGKLYGCDHPWTLAVVYGLGAIYAKLSKPEEPKISYFELIESRIVASISPIWPDKVASIQEIYTSIRVDKSWLSERIRKVWIDILKSSGRKIPRQYESPGS